MTTKPVHLLIVEDDDIDLMGLRRALSKLDVQNPITVARDGVEALEIMRGENGRRALQRPNMVLLDLNMPRMDGVSFLKAIREDPDLTDTIVVVLTTSDDQQDMLQAYRHHIAGYIVKNHASSSFRNAVEFLTHYWRTVEIPSLSRRDLGIGTA